jgi:hypothetical protein
MTIEATRDLATRLIVSTGALAAFGLALEERATGFNSILRSRLKSTTPSARSEHAMSSTASITAC